MDIELADAGCDTGGRGLGLEFFADGGAEQDDGLVGHLFEDAPGGLDPAAAWHPVVEDDHVGAAVRRQGPHRHQRFVTIDRLAHDLDRRRSRLAHHSDDGADVDLIVDDQYCGCSLLHH